MHQRFAETEEYRRCRHSMIHEQLGALGWTISFHLHFLLHSSVADVVYVTEIDGALWTSFLGFGGRFLLLS